MREEGYTEEIRSRVRWAKDGAVFAMSDFSDLASNNAANRVILRLIDEGKLLPVVRGVYQKPKYSSLLKENILPSVDEVAQALARKCRWTIRPSGDAALNQLGLSTQVPANWEYLSDGPYRKYSYGGGTIVFKHSANRLLGTLSVEASLVVQALRALGSGQLSEEAITRLGERFDARTWKMIEGESLSAPDWIRTAIRRVVKEVCHE